MVRVTSDVTDEFGAQDSRKNTRADPAPLAEECEVCWASHQCALPIRHAGDHGCIDEDDEGEPHATCPRSGPTGWGEDYLYMLDLLRYDGDFCDICGPVERAPHINAVLDHAMRAHPDRWAEEYAQMFTEYLGDGRWASPTPIEECE